MSEGDFEVLPSGEMRAIYGLTAENRPAITLDASRVPASLRHLIPMAERFGISDDLIRDDVLATSPAQDVEAMSRAVAELGDEFDKWLAGPEAEGPEFSEEYIAFTCLRMAAEEADA